MNTTHMKNTTGLIRKWFTRGMACMALLFAAGSAQAASDSWKANVAGNWNVIGSWSGNQTPGSTSADNSDVATFSFTLTGDRLVTVDNPRYIGGISFGNTSAYKYTLQTGLLRLNSGGTIQTLSGNGNHIDTISAAIQISGTSGSTATFTADATSATSLLSIGALTGSAATGNTTTLTLNGSNTGLNLMNGIIGDGSGGGKLAMVKDGAGLWRLTGANTFTGGVTLNNGTLKLENAAALGTAASSVFTIAGGNLDSTAITLGNYAQNWNGDFTFVGSASLNLGTGAVTPNANRQVTVSTNTLTVGGVIGGGAVSLTKLGAGRLTLAGANTFSGGIYIKAGTLANLFGVRAINGNDNWGPATSTIYLGDATVGANATLQDNGDGNGLSDSSHPINVVSGAGTRTISYGGSGAGLVNGPITLNNNLTVGNNGTKQFILGSSVSGTGNLTIASTFNNATWPLQLTGAINPVGAITNITTSICPSTISGAIGTNVTAVVQNSATSPMTLSSATGNSFSNTIVQAGTLTLSGPNNLSGGITVTNGTLNISGNTTNAGATTIQNGGTLNLTGTSVAATGGTGATTIQNGGTLLGNGKKIDLSAVNGNVTVQTGGKLAPGNSGATTGTLTLNLGSGTLDLSQTNAGGLRYTLGLTNASDKIALTGTLNIGSGVLNFASLQISPNSVFNASQTNYILISATNITGFLDTNTANLTGPLIPGLTTGTLAISGNNLVLNVAAGTARTSTNAVTWAGKVSGSWDNGTTNWVITGTSSPFTNYLDPDSVTFDDSATGNYTVSSVAPVAPGSVTVSNSVIANYYINASIGGPASITKLGTGTLNFNNGTTPFNGVANSFTGGLYIKAGMVVDRFLQGGDNGSFGAPSNIIYLGDAIVGADATLGTRDNNYSGLTSYNPINVVSGGGNRTIRTTSNNFGGIAGNITLNNNLQFALFSSSAGLKIGGNITGTGNLTFATTSGSGVITLQGASINPVGIITNSQGGTNTVTISGAIGANVTSVVQNSTTSTLTLSGTNNLYGGTTTVLLGTLETQKTNSLGVASSLVIADGAKMYLNFTGTNTITSLKLGNVNMPKGVYGTNAPLDNLIFRGLGKLNVLKGPVNGTMIRFY
jgi:fibronectin-binding autotransporter adhesin